MSPLSPPRRPAEKPKDLGFRLPAEWEPHAATWLAWPDRPRDWPGKAALVPWVLAEIVRQVALVEPARVLVSGARSEKKARSVFEQVGVELGQVDFVRCATDRTWARDFLPTFVVRADEVAAVKWRFNGWARFKPFGRDERAGQLVARRFSRHWRPTARIGGKSARVVLEGGAIDVDGRGTALATEQCLLGDRYRRNPGVAREAIERLFSEYLGVKRLLWLGEGIGGDDTFGHIDAIARFVAPGRVVLAQESDRRAANHRALAENRERLEGARDARGKRIEVVPLPMPQPVRHRGMLLPATYANFYIANGAVLVPTFDDPTDRIALGMLAELFPRRKVVGVHCRDLVAGGGAIHCSVMQEPRA